MIIYCHFVSAVILPTLHALHLNVSSWLWINPSVPTTATIQNSSASSANKQLTNKQTKTISNSLQLQCINAVPYRASQNRRIFRYSYRLCARKHGHCVWKQIWLLKSIWIVSRDSLWNTTWTSTCICYLQFIRPDRELPPAKFGRKQDHGGCSEVMLLLFPAQLARKSFHMPHYHNWVCFCSPLSITDIYCNKLNLVSAASLDLPEFVISGARLICCNLICAISRLAVELGGPGEIAPSGSL